MSVKHERNLAFFNRCKTFLKLVKDKKLSKKGVDDKKKDEKTKNCAT